MIKMLWTFITFILTTNTVQSVIQEASSDAKFEKIVQCGGHSNHFSSGCKAEKCERSVIDGLFSDVDIEKLHEIAVKGMNQRPTLGGPTILDINTGYIRDSNGLENLFMKDEDIFSSDDFSHYSSIISRLKNHVMQQFHLSELYFTAPTFITRIDSRGEWEPQEIHDEYWHVHADMNNTAHYQYSGLLYMSTFEKDFQGGRLHFVSPDDFSAVEDTVEPRAGRAVVFTSGSENPHFVERVTGGQRFVLAFWFTCVPEREFEIFLDGRAHTVFRWRVKDSLEKQRRKQQRQKQRSDSSEL